MAKGIIATWDEALVQLHPWRSIACAIANEDVRITHRFECILGRVEEMNFLQQDAEFRSRRLEVTWHFLTS